MTQEQGGQGNDVARAAAEGVASGEAPHGRSALADIAERAQGVVRQATGYLEQAGGARPDGGPADAAAIAGALPDGAIASAQVKTALHQLMETARKGSDGIEQSLSQMMESPAAKAWLANGTQAAQAAERTAAPLAQAAADLAGSQQNAGDLAR